MFEKTENVQQIAATAYRTTRIACRMAVRVL